MAIRQASFGDWIGPKAPSIFYLPCQAEKLQDSFFDEHIEGRHPLNPSTWIENSATPLEPAFESFDPLGNETLEVDWGSSWISSNALARVAG